MRVPRQRLHLAAHEVLDAESGLGARRPIEQQRLDPAAGPASDPDLREVADVVGMQVGGEIRRDVLVRDFERGEIGLRARPEVHDELVAVAELDQPGAVGLRPAHERPTGAERDDAHLVGREWLGVREIVVAPAVSWPTKIGTASYARIMLFPDTSISEIAMDADMQLSDRIGRRMKLHDLHVLMAVVQAGSMSKAAQLLNTTQPAVSRSIADLEHAIGVRLLDRGRQGAEPTEYGRALLDGGVAMFDDLRQAVKNIEFLADPTVGEVRVGAHDPIIVGVLPAVFDRLRRKYPGISIHVTPIVADAAAIPRPARAEVRCLSRPHDPTDRRGHSCGNPVSRPGLCRARGRKANGRAGARSRCPNWPTSLGSCRGTIQTIGSVIADAFRRAA